MCTRPATPARNVTRATSQCRAISWTSAWPSGRLKSMATLSLPSRTLIAPTSGIGTCQRIGSPSSCSILITRAPRSVRRVAPKGPAKKVPSSRMVTPSSGRAQGRSEALGPGGGVGVCRRRRSSPCSSSEGELRSPRPGVADICTRGAVWRTRPSWRSSTSTKRRSWMSWGCENSSWPRRNTSAKMSGSWSKTSCHSSTVRRLMAVRARSRNSLRRARSSSSHARSHSGPSSSMDRRKA